MPEQGGLDARERADPETNALDPCRAMFSSNPCHLLDQCLTDGEFVHGSAAEVGITVETGLEFDVELFSSGTVEFGRLELAPVVCKQGARFEVDIA